MENMASIRTCRRCGGNVFPARDDDGAYVFCLQCGAVFYQSHPNHTKATPQPKDTRQQSAPRVRAGLR